MNPLIINAYKYADPTICKIGDTTVLYIRITEDSGLVYGMDHRDFRLDNRLVTISNRFIRWEQIIKED